jgi:hypothetical protein
MPRKKKPLPFVPDEEVLAEGKFFQGNEKLLGKNAKIAWTSEMIEENKACSRNIIHFAERHFYIITDEGKEKIKLRNFQKEMLRGFKRDPRNVVLSSRQSGKTTTVTVYALWKACFNDHYKIAIVANKGDTAKQILARIKLALEGLPIYLKPGVVSWRKDGVELDNGSSIIISSTSVSSIRGSSVHCLILDEMAHCPNELMQELWQSIIPTISASKKGEIIAISTPNGANKENKFYQLYLETQKKDSIWKLHRVDWWEIPGRDENWKVQEIKTLGSLDFFRQEYENVFHPPGKSILSAELIESLKLKCKDPVLVTDDSHYKIYEFPNEKSYYVIGVDVGEGIGRTNTVAQILDISDLTNIKQVAEYANNKIGPYNFGTRLMGILNDWGRPPVLIENNSYGQQVLDVVGRTHFYENIVTYRFEGMSKHYNNENRMGVHNHTNTRYRCMTNFRYWMDALKAVDIGSYETLLEIAEFVQLPNYTFNKKTETDRDDRVWSLAWALFILEPIIAKDFYNIKETDDQGRPRYMYPFSPNSDLIKKSPLLKGHFTIQKKQASYQTPFAIIPSISDDEKLVGLEKDESQLKEWLHQWNPKIKDINPYLQKNPEIYLNAKVIEKKEEPISDDYRPIVLF